MLEKRVLLLEVFSFWHSVNCVRLDVFLSGVFFSFGNESNLISGGVETYLRRIIKIHPIMPIAQYVPYPILARIVHMLHYKYFPLCLNPISFLFLFLSLLLSRLFHNYLVAVFRPGTSTQPNKLVFGFLFVEIQYL